MADWRDRSQISDDVVYFRYSPEGFEKNCDEVYVWDLDKTYLDTAIETFSQLLVTVMERAFYKKNVPGTKTLIQALSAKWSKKSGHQRFPVFFITASPPQMEIRISEKFSIDKIIPLGCFYKDNLRNLTPKRFWRLRKQVGYKLQALMQLRVKLKENVKQVVWGDDSESDAIIYNLYSDICSRRIGTNDIRNILKFYSVTAEQIDTILLLQSQCPENDPIDKIYINLAADTDPDYYLKFGRRTVATYNTFQVVCDLFQQDRLGYDEVFLIADDMLKNYGFTIEELMRSFDDLVRRHILGEITVLKLVTFFQAKSIFFSGYKTSVEPAKEQLDVSGRVDVEGHFEPWVQDRIDYIHDYR